MSLSNATLKSRPIALPGASPYDPSLLLPLVGKRFTLPRDDNWVSGTNDAEHAYLDGARAGWSEHPEFMDFLDEDSPVHALKRMERDLYLSRWGRWLPDDLQGQTVLDAGAGIGRFTCALLDRGATVFALDADLESLRRLVWHAAGRRGKLDVFWSSLHRPPEIAADLILAAEVLCYVPDAVGALAALVSRGTPGARVLLSVEARYGWAAAQDAPQGAIEAALGGSGVLDLPGDRWVATYTREQLESLMQAAGLHVLDVCASHWLPDGPLEDTMPDAITLEQLLDLEARCASHPVWAPLHRLWLAVGEIVPK